MTEEKRIFKLEATPERIRVHEQCEAKTGPTCSGCLYRYECEDMDMFPANTPWGAFTIPTDYHREGEYFVIEEQ